MVKHKDSINEAVSMIRRIQQQSALSATLHWLSAIYREVRPAGNVLQGPVLVHIGFKNRRQSSEFPGIIESMPSVTLKKKDLLQADIEIDLGKLVEETA